VIGFGLIGLVWLVAGLVVAELVARRWPRPPDPFAYIDADPVLHHRLRPSYTANRRGVEFRINALGLKDREYPPGKPPGVFRILMLGDSYTEGFGLPVEQAMPKQVERLLAGGRCSRPIEVVNGGVSSYSPILEYLFLLHVGLALDPDLIVLSFDMTDVLIWTVFEGVSGSKRGCWPYLAPVPGWARQGLTRLRAPVRSACPRRRPVRRDSRRAAWSDRPRGRS
jgi:hypothetical protein